jgi:hypothetical protein
LIVDIDKMNQIIAKQARNKKDLVDVFLISLHFAEELATVKSDFGEQFDQQLKHLITEFADITEEPQGLPPHRGHLDHKVKLTGYPPRQRRNRLSVPEYEELKRQCTELFKEGKVRVSKSPYAAPIVMVRKSDGSIRVCIDYRAINERTVKDSFPLPRIDDLIDQLRDATCITHLDLRSAYIKSECQMMVRPMIRLLRQHFRDLLLMVLLVYWKCLLWDLVCATLQRLLLVL